MALETGCSFLDTSAGNTVLCHVYLTAAKTCTDCEKSSAVDRMMMMTCTFAVGP